MGFKRIHFSAIGNIKLIQVGPDEVESVLAEGSNEALEHIKVEQEGPDLYIRLYTWYDFLFLPHAAAYTIRLREIESFNISGSAEMDSERLTAPALDLSLSGSGRMRVRTVETANLACSSSGSGNFDIAAIASERVSIGISGSGRCRLEGRAAALVVRVSGSGDIDAAQLPVSNTEVHISGSAHVVTQVSDALDVHISGAGEVLYQGNPQVSQSVSGSATIRRV